MLGGIVASALALPDRYRRFFIATFSVLAVGNLILIIRTSEATSDMPHFSDLLLSFKAAAEISRNRLGDLVQDWFFELGLALVVGTLIGIFGPREYQKRVRRNWFSSYDIFKLANPELMKNAYVAEDEVQKLSEQIRDLAIQRENLRIPFGIGPVSEEYQPMALLREAAREASAKNIALHELREKARRNALDDLYEKLKVGTLIARGFKDPLGLNPKEVEIEASYWKFLKFTSDYKEAEGKGIKFTGIEVARK
jgi:hypothetical protein